ncbi:hypothetical protein [Ralstonia phage RP31]|uniref:Uncharacterized protein n=2 Tax=Ripduovirus RP12 TaxID=2560700 RepID=A0A1L7N0X1_9CAUD|nr:hypothetical protein FDH28_gp279 [Ralstonia phage RP12]BAW19116.1 hypothetical protein [Ralstonia phage RP12]BAW19402.1 hypothetical protein [Ralstonia phage RP31]
MGPVQRSIGYLQGGYKDSTVHSKVQLFNTTTQVGQLVYDTGYQRNYRPGISGAYNGYFSISDTTAYNKFNYITASASASFTTARDPSVSVSDLNVYSQAWILATVNPSIQASIDGDWYKVDLTTDTPTSQGLLSSAPYGSTRQAIGTGSAGFFLTPANQSVTTLNFTTKAVASGIGGPSALDSNIQIPCGMSVNNTRGYFVGMLGRNVRLDVSGSTIQAFTVASSYSYNFGESHALANSSYGFMMAGYSDTTGRYGNTQHGLCQRISLATEAIATLPDLVLAQSSGQMMQGF